jgi:hypothetical protein
VALASQLRLEQRLAGLTIGTVLTMVAVPVFYAVFNRVPSKDT